ncbi:MAG: DUF4350 domain-containing protein [Methanothermobacter sp.]|nr:DUF4350 domain-containing protein [Methanothermobacter sp.]
MRLSSYIRLIIFISFLIIPIIATPNIVMAQDDIRILFDETRPYGKYYTIYNLGPYGASSFATLLEDNGATVSRITEAPLTYEKLKNYDVLILMAPGRNYTDQEIKDIKKFVNNGGGLLLVGEPWGPQDGDKNYAFNKIARSFGVDLTFNEIIVDTKHNMGISRVIKTDNIRSHPITANISEIYYITGAYQDPGAAEVLVYSDADSWSDHGYVTSEGESANNEIKEADEAKGPLPLISAMEYGRGKIIFIGSAQTFVNAWLYRSNGWKLGLNSVNWLVDRPAPSNYEVVGLISPTLGDLSYRIFTMIIFTLILGAGLIFKIKRDDKTEILKTIKNWKFNSLIGVNAISAVISVLLFIPINLYLLNSSIPEFYDPYFAYTLIITGVLLLFFNSMIVYNMIHRRRLVINHSYFNISILLFFAGLTMILGDIFSFPMMFIFTIGSFFLLVPFLVNLWIIRGYGPDLIIEGKEFDQLKRLSVKSLPFELHAYYDDPMLIGDGGFGRIFKATRKDRKEVAIKIPKSFDKKSEKIFVSEVSNWSKLDHPNIVKLYDFKILPIPYIEMEFCEESVANLKYPFKKAVSIVHDVAKGLQYAHGKNIIHGDVKTSNILGHDGIYKISDWGLSKLKIGESVTLSGATPQYAAPEQISQEFGKADERTDIYQLGIVFYELVTGDIPFKGEMSELYSSILNTLPTPPSDINPSASMVENIIMKCLSKNKEDRYSCMGELIEELEKFYKAESSDSKTMKIPRLV